MTKLRTLGQLSHRSVASTNREVGTSTEWGPEVKYMCF